jgi:PIN domain nuclease of toxin-antitoxin system
MRRGLRATVLDSYAILAFLFGEHGDEMVATALEKAAETGKRLLIASPNWAEVRYQVERKVGTRRWTETRARLLSLPIDIVPVDQDLAEDAGALKAVHRMSLADCFAAALTAKVKGEVLTGDPEFKSVQDHIRVVWLKPSSRSPRAPTGTA